MIGPTIGDAFGEALLVQLGGGQASIVYERDDGFVDSDTGDYFVKPDAWEEVGRWCLDHVEGRVLDIGAGAGRAALALQDRGQDVTALDVSPGALEVCRRRGVRDTFLGEVTQLATESSARFDGLLALGNNLGLLGSPEHAPQMFDALKAVSTPGATIAGTCLDPTAGEPPPWHARYHELNRGRGRMAGHITLRTRFRDLATEWFDLLWMSPEQLDELAKPCGWEVADVQRGPVDVRSGMIYGAVLRRTDD